MLRNFCKFAFLSLVKSVPPSLGQSLYFLRYHGRWPNLQNPRSLNEKILRRKLIEDPLHFRDYADKLKAKEIVAKRVGEKFVNPTLWSGTELPDERTLRGFIPFVLKANFGNNRTVFVCSANDMNYEKLRLQADVWLKGPSQDPVMHERWYEHIERKLLIERHLGDGKESPSDFKVFCFHGQPLFIQVDSQRFSEHRRDFYDVSWKHLEDLSVTYPTSIAPIEQPPYFVDMMSSAAALSAGFKFVRVDFYSLPEIIFGEFTFAPGAGFERFKPYKYDLFLGGYW